MDKKDAKDLLERYENGQGTDAEKQLLEEWFDSEAEHNEWQWTDAEALETGKRIKSGIDKQLLPGKNLWPILRVAAVLFITIGGVLLFRNEIRDVVDPVVYVEKQVGEHQQLKLTLPDGSKVLLNAQSRIRYPNRFNHHTRQVYLLEGEGYFEVKHDTKHPFIVTSKNTNTQVLGTAFNIKAYHYLSELQVAVTRGKVSVSTSDGTKKEILLPNEVATVDSQNGTMLKQVIDAKTIVAWQHGNLAFNNERLTDVCATIASTYHLQFKFDEPAIKDFRITAGFVATDRVSEIIDILASANNLAYVKQGNTITFKKR
ncbi:hypothetical protein AB669_13235 [Pedobacter sp. BMA]|nr:hypothetical protein AB669_13235 [Pedobacter sp. BMA]